MSVDLTPHAVHDIDTAADDLEERRAGTAGRFRDALLQTFERLEQLPESAALLDPPSTRYVGLRVAQVSRFKSYAVYYRPTSDGVLIVRVLHASRNADPILYPDPDPPTPPGA